MPTLSPSYRNAPDSILDSEDDVPLELRHTLEEQLKRAAGAEKIRVHVTEENIDEVLDIAKNTPELLKRVIFRAGNTVRNKLQLALAQKGDPRKLRDVIGVKEPDATLVCKDPDQEYNSETESNLRDSDWTSQRDDHYTGRKEKPIRMILSEQLRQLQEGKQTSIRIESLDDWTATDLRILKECAEYKGSFTIMAKPELHADIRRELQQLDVVEPATQYGWQRPSAVALTPKKEPAPAAKPSLFSRFGSFAKGLLKKASSL